MGVPGSSTRGFKIGMTSIEQGRRGASRRVRRRRPAAPPRRSSEGTVHGDRLRKTAVRQSWRDGERRRAARQGRPRLLLRWQAAVFRGGARDAAEDGNDPRGCAREGAGGGVVDEKGREERGAYHVRHQPDPAPALGTSVAGCVLDKPEAASLLEHGVLPLRVKPKLNGVTIAQASEFRVDLQAES